MIKINHIIFISGPGRAEGVTWSNLEMFDSDSEAIHALQSFQVSKINPFNQFYYKSSSSRSLLHVSSSPLTTQVSLYGDQKVTFALTTLPLDGFRFDLIWDGTMRNGTWMHNDTFMFLKPFLAREL
jgi:hypothetical protein